MKQVFGLREPLRPDEPGPHPARLHPGLHRGRRRRGPAGPHPGGPRRVLPIATSCSSRGPGTPGSGRSSGSRTRPWRRCSAPRPSSSPRAASAGRSTRSSSTPRCSSATGSRSPGRSSTRSTSTRSPGWRGRSSAAWLATGSRCWASCRTGRSCRTRPWRWSSRASTARRSTRARPRRGHRRDRHRGDGARAHAPADRAAQPGHRAGRPGRRHQRDRRRARDGSESVATGRSASC